LLLILSTVNVFELIMEKSLVIKNDKTEPVTINIILSSLCKTILDNQTIVLKCYNDMHTINYKKNVGENITISGNAQSRKEYILSFSFDVNDEQTVDVLAIRSNNIYVNDVESVTDALNDAIQKFNASATDSTKDNPIIDMFKPFMIKCNTRIIANLKYIGPVTPPILLKPRPLRKTNEQPKASLSLDPNYIWG
jgi:hypothetical protein